MNPVVTVLVAAGGAAFAAAFGVLPLLARPRPPKLWLGWANALAAGMMLAAAFALAEPQFAGEVMPFALGAFVGIAFVHGSRSFSETAQLRLNELDETDPVYGYEVLLVSSLHASAEGVAIGAAMAVGPAFGIFVATAMALHNVPEGTLLAAVFTARGASLARAAMLAVVSNFGQLLMGVSTFAIATAAPATLPWALGFAVGALVYLVMVDLLPDSYSEAGPTSVALTVILAIGAFGLLQQALLP